jgi:hypothetical protein
MSISLAPEIWDKIVKHACVDGGHTGCALSLVSRYIRAVSHLSHLQSISLNGQVAMRDFLRELKRRPSAERLVRFVYIKGTIEIFSSSKQRFDDYGTSWPDIYNDFFKMISPTVEMITVDAEPHWRDRMYDMIPHFGDLRFPRLTALTASNTVLQFLMWNGRPLADGMDRLPALKQLHLFLDFEYRLNDDDNYFRVLLQQTPHLTHLRISDVYDSLPFTLSVGSMIGIPEYITSLVQLLHGWSTDEAAQADDRLRRYLEAHRLHHLRALIFDHSSDKVEGSRSDGIPNKITQLVTKYQGYQQIRMAYFQSSPSASSGGLRRAWEDVATGGLGAWDMERVSGDLIYSAPSSNHDY